ncbi:MAG: hypothetical protein DI535_01415 [Citrobacter freundii]|nr:MAG: hypothetical protein DI535_01415 [Citrobacter freundii]
MAEEVIEVFWTESAKSTFDQIIKYLQREWSDKEVEKFVGRTFELIRMLRQYPEMCRPSVKRKNVHIGILDKHTQLIYQYRSRKSV